MSAKPAHAPKAVDPFDKCARYTTAKEMIGRDLYPYFQPIERSFDTEVVIRGDRKIMVGSNNYLGLTHHPHVLERAREALERYGTGCTGSRFLNGTLDLHEELEIWSTLRCCRRARWSGIRTATRMRCGARSKKARMRRAACWS